MSRPRRSTSGPWRRHVDPERLSVVLVVAGTAVAIAMVLLGGFLSFGEILSALLYPFAVLFPVLGAAVVIAVLWWTFADRPSTVPAMVDGPPPEASETRTEYPVGRETSLSLHAATRGRYRCRPTDSDEDLRDRLTEGAVRVLRANRGLEAAAAREAVRSGTWTADPVAAAFLAPERRYPLDERLRAAVDPGAAYHRRVRRTLDAIDAVAAGARLDRSESESQLESAPESEVER